MLHKNIFLFTLSFLVISATAAAKRSGDNGDVSGNAGLETTVEMHGQSLATLTNQVNAMVTQVQMTAGDIGRVDKKNVDQDKLLKDSQVRLQTLEDRISILTTQLQELKTEGLLKPAATQRLNEFQNYSLAVENINARNYKKAVTDLQAFQEKYKKSPFVSHAQFWVGEAYYLQSDYEMAIAEYQKMLSKDVRSPKASTALYKQGLSFFHLQSFDDAKEFFAKVIRNYPQSIEAVQASSQIARINRIIELKENQEAETQDVTEGY